MLLVPQVWNLLRRHYPAHIMPDLQRYSQRALEDLAEGFPHSHIVSRHNLDKFLEVMPLAVCFTVSWLCAFRQQASLTKKTPQLRLDSWLLEFTHKEQVVDTNAAVADPVQQMHGLLICN